MNHVLRFDYPTHLRIVLTTQRPLIEFGSQQVQGVQFSVCVFKQRSCFSRNASPWTEVLELGKKLSNALLLLVLLFCLVNQALGSVSLQT